MSAHRDGPLIIGLVGGIGSGKSTVAAAFERAGCVVADADAAVRAALASDDVARELASWWGPGVLDADGRVDRRAVGRIVFDDPAKRERLEGLLHPFARADRAKKIEDARTSGVVAVVVDAPLLFEAGLDDDCDLIVFVDAPRKVRLARVAARGWDEAELDRRESAQLSLEAKRRRADAVLANHGSSTDASGPGPEDATRLDAAVRDLLADAARRRG